jgi:hypothetical protein
MMAFLLGSLFRRWVLSIAILLTVATSPSIGWMPSKSIIVNYGSSRRSSFSSQQKPLLQSFQIDHDEITNDTPPSIIDNDDGGKNGFPPLLRIGKRIGSGAYGTVHIAQFVDNHDDKKQYIAKRAWTLAELELNVPSAVMQLEKNSWNHPRTGVTRQLLDGGATGVVEEGSSNDDVNNISSDSKDKLKERAERCRYYWNVERHIFQKLSSSSSQMKVNINNVTPQFMGVFQSAIDNDDGGEEEIVPGYGTIGKHDTDNNNNNNKQLGGGFFSMNMNNNRDDDDKGHEWMVFEFIPSSIDSAGNDDDSPALTLLDAMEVSL